MSSDDRLWGCPWLRERTAIYIYARVLYGFQIQCQYSGNDPSFAPKPGPSVYGTRLFLACLSLDLDLMAAIVSGIDSMLLLYR